MFAKSLSYASDTGSEPALFSAWSISWLQWNLTAVKLFWGGCLTVQFGKVLIVFKMN